MERTGLLSDGDLQSVRGKACRARHHHCCYARQRNQSVTPERERGHHIGLLALLRSSRAHNSLLSICRARHAPDVRGMQQADVMVRRNALGVPGAANDVKADNRMGGGAPKPGGSRFCRPQQLRRHLQFAQRLCLGTRWLSTIQLYLAADKHTALQCGAFFMGEPYERTACPRLSSASPTQG